jgi:hypothetical protein
MHITTWGESLETAYDMGFRAIQQTDAASTAAMNGLVQRRETLSDSDVRHLLNEEYGTFINRNRPDRMFEQVAAQFDEADIDSELDGDIDPNERELFDGALDSLLIAYERGMTDALFEYPYGTSAGTGPTAIPVYQSDA